MPKRNNPFGDHSTLQLKTHVREKEVDKGVCQQTRMQSVYERTQQLLFSGMRHKEEERSEAVDSNDNIMSWSDENTKADNSAMKQLHLDKNCQLVNTEVSEDSSNNSVTDMDTDMSSCPCSLPQIPAVFNFCTSSKLAETTYSNCNGLLSPSCSFGRNPNEYSPPNVLSSNQGPLPDVIASSNSAPNNAFMHLKQAQLKKAWLEKNSQTCRACHNCRQPVQSRDVMKCQFCENYVCCGCVRQCGNCHLHYCQLCSVINYDQSTERAFCLNCRGR